MVTILRLKDPGEPPEADAEDGRLMDGPLYDLVALQKLLQSGDLNLGNDDQCVVGTDECWNYLKKLGWLPGKQVQELILRLKPGKGRLGDYVNSQWCKDSDGYVNPCDAYRIRVDELTWKRDVNAPMYYVKFSIEDSGQIYLVLISCHLDKAF